MKSDGKFWGVLEALELLLSALFVAIGPFVWMYRLAAAGMIAAFSLVAFLWLASVCLIAWEIRRSRFTAISLGVAIGWFITLCIVFLAAA